MQEVFGLVLLCALLIMGTFLYVFVLKAGYEERELINRCVIEAVEHSHLGTTDAEEYCKRKVGFSPWQ